MTSAKIKIICSMPGIVLLTKPRQDESETMSTLCHSQYRKKYRITIDYKMHYI